MSQITTIEEETRVVFLSRPCVRGVLVVEGHPVAWAGKIGNGWLRIAMTDSEEGGLHEYRILFMSQQVAGYGIKSCSPITQSLPIPATTFLFLDQFMSIQSRVDVIICPRGGGKQMPVLFLGCWQGLGKADVDAIEMASSIPSGKAGVDQDRMKRVGDGLIEEIEQAEQVLEA